MFLSSGGGSNAASSNNSGVAPVNDSKTILQAHLGNNLSAVSFVSGNANVVNDTRGTGNWKFYVAGNTSIAAVTGANGSSGEWTVGNLMSYVPGFTPFVSDYLIYYTFSSNKVSGTTVYDSVTNFQGTLTATNATIAVDSNSRVPGQGYLKLLGGNMTFGSFTTGASGMSFSIWFYSNNTTDWGRIFQFGTTNTNRILAAIFASKLRLYVDVVTVDTSLTPTNNTWYHFVWTIASNGTWIVYINGTSIYNAVQIYPPSLARTSNYFGGSPNGEYLTGGVDNFRYYNYVLSQANVTSIYESGDKYPSVASLTHTTGTTWMPIPGTPVDSSETLYTVKSNEVALIPGTNSTYAVWTATKSTNLKIDVSFADYNSRSANGVGFQMFKIKSDNTFDSVLFPRTVTSTALTNAAPTNYLTVPSINTTVNAGDKIYYRVDGNGISTSASSVLATTIFTDAVSAAVNPVETKLLQASLGNNLSTTSFVAGNANTVLDTIGTGDWKFYVAPSTSIAAITSASASSEWSGGSVLPYVLPPSVPTDMAFWYTFNSDKVSGNTIYDSVSGTYSATLFGSPVATIATDGSPGPGQGYLSLTATSSQYATLPTFTTGTNGLSFAFWFRSNATGNYARIFDFTNGIFNNMILFGLNTNGFFIDVDNSLTTEYAKGDVGGISMNDNIWRHVVLIFHPTNGWTLYLNGVSYYTDALGPYPDAVSRTINYIGKSVDSSPYFNGGIDDFRYYSRAISADEVSLIYSQPALYYPFDVADINPSNTTQFGDLATGSYVYNGTITRATIAVDGNSRVSGKGYLSLVKSNGQYANIAPFAVLTSGITFATWFRATSNNTNYSARILDMRDPEISIQINIGIRFYGGAGFQTSAAINDNVWRHLAITIEYAGASSIYKCYINGTLQTLDNSQTSKVGAYVNLGLRNPYYNLGTAGNNGSANTAEKFDGGLDDFRIYHRPLSQAEVTALYAGPQPPTLKDAVTGATWMSKPAVAVDATETSYTVKSTEIALKPGTNSTYAVWTAPKTTNLKIDVSFADYHSRSTSGVGFQMFKINRDNTFGSVIFPRTTTVSAITDATLLTGTSSYLSVPSRTISVATGDKIYYRIDGNGNPTSASSVLATNIYVDPNQDLKQNTILQAHLGNNLTATSFVSGNANVVNDTLGTGNWKFYVAGNTSIAAVTGASASSEWTGGSLLSYVAPTTPTDYAIYFPFETADVIGSTVADLATGTPVYNGTLVGASATVVVDPNPRVSGKGYLSLIRTGTYFKFAPANTFSIVNTGLTIAFWGRFASTMVPGARIFDMRDPELSFQKNGSGATSFRVYVNYGGGAVAPLNSDNNVFDSGWRHYAVTITYGTGTTSSYKLYINGGVTATATDYYPALGTRGSYNLGSYGDTGGTSNYGVDGGIDDFRIYQRPLSAAEVTSLYTGPSPPTLSDTVTSTGATWMPTPGTPVDSTETLYTVKSNEIALKPGSNSTYAVWTATKSTNLKIDVSFADYNSRSANGVGFQMFKIKADNTFDSVLFPRTVTSTALTNSAPSNYLTVPTINTTVTVGDKIYYRVDGNGISTSASSVLATTIFTDAVSVASNPVENKLLQAQLATNLNTASFVAGNTNTVLDTLGSGDWKFYVAPSTSIAAITSASASSEWTGGNLLSYSPPEPPPVNYSMYYPFETADKSGSTVADLATGSPVYNGTLMGSADIVVNGGSRVSGQGYLSLTQSTNNYFNFNTINITIAGFTIAMWFRATDTTSVGNSWIFDMRTDSSNIFAITCGLNAGNPGVRLYTPQTNLSTLSPSDIRGNVWRHLAITIQYGTGATSVYKCYLDGVLQSTNLDNYPQTGTRNANRLGGVLGGGLLSGFDGGFDDFRYYNRAITDDEVTAIYAGSIPAKISDTVTLTGATWMPIPGTPVISSETSYTVKSTEIALIPGTNSTYAVWTAPKSTNLKIDVSFADYHSRSTSGVGFQMFKINRDNTFGSVIFPRTTTGNAITDATLLNGTSSYLTVPTKSISVATGDKIYYRIDGNGNPTSASSVLATNIYVDPNQDLKQNTILQAHLGNNLTATSFVSGNANVVNDTLRTGNWKFYVAGNTSVAAVTGASGSSGEWTMGNLLSYTPPQLPASDYALYYTFDVNTVLQTTGNTILDSVSGTLNASLASGAKTSTGVPTKYGIGSLDLSTQSGSGVAAQHLKLPTFTISQSTGFSVSFWAYFTEISNRYVFDFSEGTGTANNNAEKHLILAYEATTNRYSYFPNYPEKSGVYRVSANDKVIINQWQHICLTISTTAITRVYLNSAVIIGPHDESSQNIFGTKTAAALGTLQFGGPGTKGYIDDFKIYHRALTADEVNGIYLNTIIPAKLSDAVTTTGAAWIPTPGTVVDSTETLYTVKSNEIALKPGTNSTYAVWTATKSTNLKIDVSFADYNSRSANGVGFQMFKIKSDNTFDSVLFPRTVTSTALTNSAPTNYLTVPSINTTVNAGDKIYYRVDGNGISTSASSVLATAIYTDAVSTAVNPVETKLVQAQLATNLSNATLVAGNANTILDTTGAGDWKFYVAPSTSIAAISAASASSEWSGGSILPYVLPPSVPTDMSLCFTFNSDKVSGTTIYDSTGNFTGTLVNNATIATDGSPGPGQGYLSLTKASGQYVKFVQPFSILQNGITVTTWFRATSNNTNGTGRIYDFRPDDGTSEFSMNVANGGIQVNAGASVYSTNVLDNVWRHLALTVDAGVGGVNSIYKTYINGVLQTTVSTLYPTAVSRTVCNIGTSYNIGTANYGGAFDGGIDDFRFYQRTLTADEVSLIYSQPATYYPFETADINPSVTTQVGDLATGSPVYNTTLFNGANIAVDGNSRIPGQGYLSLAKVNTTYQYANFVKFGIVNSGLSFSLWARLTSNTDQNGGRIIDINDTGLANRILFTRSGANSLFVHIEGQSTVLSYNTSVFDGFWRHYAITIAYGGTAGASSAYKLYINGVNVSTYTGAYPPLGVRANYNFGAMDATAGQNGIDGGIDDFRVYQRPLSQAEVTALYAGTQPPTLKDTVTGVTWLTKPATPVDSTETSYTVKSNEIALKPGTNSTYAVWTSPKSTNIRLDVSFADYHTRSTSGVGFQIFKINADNTFGSTIFSRTTTVSALTDLAPTNYLTIPSTSLSVSTGDKVVYRIDGNGNPTSSSSVLATNIYSYSGRWT